jgi:hypothetical protein
MAGGSVLSLDLRRSNLLRHRSPYIEQLMAKPAIIATHQRKPKNEPQWPETTANSTCRRYLIAHGNNTHTSSLLPQHVT